MTRRLGGGLLLALVFGFSASLWAGPAPAGYYYRTFGLSGETLRAALNETIAGHTVQPYTLANQGDAWTAMQVLDRDPLDPSRVLMVFTGASVPGSDTKGGFNSNITSSSWEREHIWPRSYGVGSDGADFSDLFNLRPIDQGLNQTRGNRIFDAPLLIHPTDPAVAPPGAPDCLYDAAGGQGRLWQARASERGDLARVIFYMATRYDGSDFATQRLQISDEPDSARGRFGRLSTLLQWHLADPVDDEERRRNNLMFADYQGNRNPFVDDPELAARVFAGANAAPSLSLTLNRSSVALDDGAGAVTGVVTLSEPAAEETLIHFTMSAAIPGLSVPASVSLAAGQRSLSFSINAQGSGVPSFQSYRQDWSLTATSTGYGSSSAGLRVLGSGGRGWETFDRLLIYGSFYRDGSFTGDQGVGWNFSQATGQGDFPIDGRGILLRRDAQESRVISGPIRGGIDSVAVDLRKAFTASGVRQVEILINGVSRGISPSFGSATGENDSVLTYVIPDLAVAGDFTLEIRNVGSSSTNRQLVIDNVRWTGYPAGASPGGLLEAIPGQVTAPTANVDAGPGEAVVFRLRGTELAAGSILAEAPAGFELSADGVGFSPSVAVEILAGGVADALLSVRLAGGLDAGEYAGPVSFSAGGAAPIFMPVSATVAELFPDANYLRAGGYAQSFGGFAESGLLPPGWSVLATGSAANRHDVSLWGTTTTTGIKRGTEADPLLGYQHAAETGVASFTVDLENRSGSEVTALAVSYIGRAARTTQGRLPEFTVNVGGQLVSALSYSVTEGDGVTRSARIGGFSIAPGASFSIIWSSDRGEPSGASQQIGLSALAVSVPPRPTVALVGPAQLVMAAGEMFDDPGAVGSDPVEGSFAALASGVVDGNSPGEYTLSYVATNSIGLASDPVTRTVTVLSALSYYLEVVHGLTGADADPLASPAEDGISNLIKFAVNGVPRELNFGILPRLVQVAGGRSGLSFHSGPELLWDANTSTLHGGGIRMWLESSVDLLAWDAAATELVVPADLQIAAGREITLSPLDVPAGMQQFLRLVVAVQP